MNKLTWCVRSEKGIGHRQNEDASFCAVSKHQPGRGIFAVADGVGSLDEAKKASHMAMTAIRDWWQTCDLTQKELLRPLKACIREIDEKIRRAAEDKKICMATTLTVLLIEDTQAGILQIGDSKIVRKRQNKMEILTIDHLLKQEGLLISCLGNARSDCHIMMRAVDLQPKDEFFVGTDGVFSKNQMMKSLSFGQEKIYFRRLRDLGEDDDLTLVSIKVSEVAHD